MKARSAYRQKTKGASTIEILVAFFMFVLVVTAVTLVLFGSQTMLLQGELSHVALYKAKVELENSLSGGFDYFPDETVADGIYTKEIKSEAITNYAKKITSEVSWGNLALQKVSLSRIVTDWKNAEGTDTCDLFLGSLWKNPHVIKSVAGFATTTGIDVLNKKIYLAVNSNLQPQNDLYVLDGDDLHTMFAVDTGPGLNAIHTTSGYAYVANSSVTAQLQIIDINDFSNPIVSFRLPLEAPLNEDRIGNTIFYADKKVYLGTDKSNGPEFHVIAVSDPLNPISLGSFETNSTVNGIFVLGHKAYVATTGSKQLRVLDVENPHDVQELGSVSPLSWSPTQGGKSVYPLGDKVYFGRTWGRAITEEFFVYGSNLNGSSLSSTILIASVNGIFVRNNLAFLATNDASKEFQVWDIKSSRPVSRSFLNLGADGVGLDCDGKRFYIATENGVEIVEDVL